MEVLLSRQLKIMFTFLLSFFFEKHPPCEPFKTACVVAPKSETSAILKTFALLEISVDIAAPPLKCLPVYGTLSCGFLFLFLTELFSLACNTFNTTFSFKRESLVFYFSLKIKIICLTLIYEGMFPFHSIDSMHLQVSSFFSHLFLNTFRL